MDTDKRNLGDPVEPCHNDPLIRVRDTQRGVEGTDLDQSIGYTSRGYINHFLPDREVNLAKMNRALADVFGEPTLRMMNMTLEIDKENWVQISGNQWSGNIYQYSFRPQDDISKERQRLEDKVQVLQAEIDTLKQRQE